MTDGRPDEQSRIEWPGRKRFAFTVFDDPDGQTVEMGKRVYGLLAELNTRPRTTYLSHVKNPNPEMEG